MQYALTRTSGGLGTWEPVTAMSSSSHQQAAIVKLCECFNTKHHLKYEQTRSSGLVSGIALHRDEEV
jgi:hypothetical protein